MGQANGADLLRNLAGGEHEVVFLEVQRVCELGEEEFRGGIAPIVFQIVEILRRDRPAIGFLDHGGELFLAEPRLLPSVGKNLTKGLCTHWSSSYVIPKSADKNIKGETRRQDKLWLPLRGLSATLEDALSDLL
jgi:hypothetical protein